MIVQDLILHYSKPSYVLEGRDIDRVHKLAEVCKHHLLASCKKFVSNRLGEPLLEVYMSDGTPLTTVERHDISWLDRKVRRLGRNCGEWLAQRLFLVDGSGNSRVLVTDPVLMADKTAMTHYNCQEMFWQGGRLYGHEGILVSVCIWDRAVFSACKRRQQQRAEAYRIHTEAVSGEGVAHMQWLLHWQVFSPCRAHDCHNALKWSTQLQVSDRATMRSVWIVLESLRNAYSLLVRALPSWLPARLVFQTYQGSDLAGLYRVMGISDEWLPLFVDLQLRWQDGCLMVRADLEHFEDTPKQISLCLLHIWKFRTWSDSRWCGMTRACRCLVQSLCCGLADLVKWIQNDPSMSNYYIDGFNHLSMPIIRFACVVTCAGRVSEEPLAIMLADDRLPRIVDKVDQCIAQQRDYALGLGSEVLLKLAQISTSSMRELYDDISQAVLVQLGYMSKKMQDLRQPPWSLCLGNIEVSLKGLGEAAPATDVTTRKIQLLVQMGYPMESLVPAIRLMAEAPHTTRAVEQAHNVASSLLKQHKMYGQSTMQARAMVSAMQPLVREDPDRKRERNLSVRIDRLANKCPQRIGARHVYMRSLVDRAAHSTDSRYSSRSVVAKKVMKGHGKQFNKLAPSMKLSLQRDAELLQDERREANTSHMRFLRSARQSLLEKLRRNAKLGTHSIRMTSCRLTLAMLDELDDSYNVGPWSGEYVDSLREVCHKAVGPPPATMVKTLDDMSVGEHSADAVSPEWLSWMCHHRDYFRSCILRLHKADSFDTWKFVYATQNPLEVCLVKCVEVVAVEPAMLPGQYHDVVAGMWDANFMTDCSCFGFARDMVFDSVVRIEAMPDVVGLPVGSWGSDSSWLSLDALKTILPQAPMTRPHGSGARPRPPVGAIPEHWADHPHFWEDVKETDLSDAKKKSLLVDRSSDSSSDGTDSDDLAREFNAMSDLLAKRAELEKLDPISMESCFRYTVRGGAWTAGKKGIAFDCFLASAVKGPPLDFCMMYKMHGSASSSIVAYGEEACIVLCRSWCHRLFHYYNLWLCKGGKSSFVFSPADHEKYVKPEELRNLAVGAPVKLAKRIASLEAIRPR
jgi:hypothetical protein